MIEFLFNYQGIGLLIFDAAQHKDFTLLHGRRPRRSASCTCSSRSSPTSSTRCSTRGIRYGTRRMSTVAAPDSPRRPARRGEAPRARERLRLLAALPTLHRRRRDRRAFWVVCACSRLAPDAVRPALRPTSVPRASRPARATGSAPTARSRRLLARARRLARHPARRAAGDAARHRARHRRSASITGYFRGIVDDVLSRVIDAVLAMPADRDRRHRASPRSAPRTST